MREGASPRLAIMAALALLPSGCGQSTRDMLLDWDRGTGYFSAGPIVHSTFPGDSKGLENGAGYSITMPPLFPLAVAAIAYVAPYDPFGGSLVLIVPGVVSGVSDAERKVVSELSLDLTFAESFHDDAAFGGRAEYESWLLGVRLGGPARYIPSYTLSAGWGWYKFEFDSRSDARAEGPYLGAGLRFFLSENVKLNVEYVRHYHTTDVDAGAPEEGARQIGVTITGAWYF